MSVEIAVVGMACWYPGARSPRELWENILTRRQQFRRFLDQRMPASDYHSDDPHAPDRSYGRLGAFLDGFAFDCEARRVPRSTYAATDISHWLALEVAAQALADAGHTEGQGLPRERTGVILGNSLTGEFSRATSLRLRWPFMERVLRETAVAQQLTGPPLEQLVAETRERYLAYFPPTSEDTLAGALSNTIAGRICGVFDFGGGGYVVDGACSSSLLSVCTAASSLAEGRVDACLAGGVDISMDPFELVGFAKARALAPGAMRVYDRRGNGFIPGEGCGFVLLKRLEDAKKAGDIVYATIRGWGISSDGRNAITAPKVEGQVRAIRTAWEQGGIPEFVEGHGTGTTLGDRVELTAIATAAGSMAPRSIGVTSLKSILGHTKAAAGIGAFLKAAIAVNRRVLPPTAGCIEPNLVFEDTAQSLYPLRQGKVLPPNHLLVGGASSMGFGGINAHIVIASAAPPDPRLAPSLPETSLLWSTQTSELFVFGAASRAELHAQIQELLPIVADISWAELLDLSAELLRRIPPTPRIRAAVIADSPDVLLKRLEQLLTTEAADGPEVWLGTPTHKPRIGFLCPGQGSQDLDSGHLLLARHPELAERANTWIQAAIDAGGPDLRPLLYPDLDRLRNDAEGQERRNTLARTENAQPALCFLSLLWAERLSQLGLEPVAIAGHSLGELSALSLAGAFDGQKLMQMAVLRGQAMAAPGNRPAGMLSMKTSVETAQKMIADLPGYLAVANINGPTQVVIAGEEDALLLLSEQASKAGISARRLPVSNGFHSELVASAGERLLQESPLPERPENLRYTVWSSLQEEALGLETPLRAHIAQHVRAPVNFMALIQRMHRDCDLLIEVGAGRVLSGLTEAILGTNGPRCAPVEGSPGRSQDLQIVMACAWIRGANPHWNRWNEGRLLRPFLPPSQRLFFTNPCEVRPDGLRPQTLALPTKAPPSEVITTASEASSPQSTPQILEHLLHLVAERTGFSRASLSPDQRLRDELNLDSIKAGELVATVARRMGVADRIDAAQLSTHPLQQIADALALQQPSGETPITPPKASVTVAPLSEAPRWVRAFGLSTLPAPLATPPPWAGRRLRLLPGFVELEDHLCKVGAILEGEPEFILGILSETSIPEQLRQLRMIVDAITPSVRGLLLVQRLDGQFGLGDGGSGGALNAFARSLWLERPHLAIRVVDLGSASERCLMDELPEVPSFSAFGYTPLGRQALVARPLQPALAPARQARLQAGDLLLVTGGGRGITFACALALARQNRLRLALVGSTPRQQLDPELLQNLGQAVMAGVEAHYWPCDLGNPEAVKELVQHVRSAQGPIAAVLHGAGRNHPQRVEHVAVAQALQEIAPKLLGAASLMEALADHPPRFFMALTSIIGVTGMQGNAWYAFANENLDLLVARFAQRYGSISLCLAYGIWDSIGMGAKLGSVATLGRQGIAALPPEEGIARFLWAVHQDPGVRQPILCAHLDGLPTWPAEFPVLPELPFLLGKRQGVPGVEARIELRLHPDAHPWLKDHVYQGSLLLPTVLGLEAMAQVATLAHGPLSIQKITDIQLPHPVVVSNEGTQIQLRALVSEDDPHQVLCELRTEQSGFSRPHFSACFHFAARPSADLSLPDLPPPPLPLSGQDLYGGLLFQGPAFQRMGRITGAMDRAVRFDGEAKHSAFILGDPFFRDALLQAGQLLIPHDDALPVAIDQILFFEGEEGTREVLATLDRSEAQRHWGTVVVRDAAGRCVERLEGYQLQILNHHSDRPALAEILDPAQCQLRLQMQIAQAAQAQGLPIPQIALDWSGLGALNREERHQAEQLLLETLRPQMRLQWEPSGRPILGDEELSLSHDTSLCLLALGPVGCDLEPIYPRADWPALLGPRQALLASLREDRDTAGTRLWAAAEALYKRGARQPIMRLETQEGSYMAFSAMEGDQRWRVLTWALQLARGPRRILAFAWTDVPAPTIDPDNHRVCLRRGATDQMETRFIVSFDDSASVSGQVPVHTLASWMGRLRELALAELQQPLLEALSSGQHGMVTQSAEASLSGEAHALDRIEATTWVEELRPTTCLLRFSFRRKSGSGWEKVGQASQRFGWVHVLGHGQVRASAFPSFLYNFLASLQQDAPHPAPSALALPQGRLLLQTRVPTSLVDSNVVGNLYYAHYFRWAQRAVDQWLWQKQPGLLKNRGQQGEMKLSQLRIEFLREAMPFDVVEVSLYLDSQLGNDWTFTVLYQRQEADGSTSRLALAQLLGRWLQPNDSPLLPLEVTL